MSTPHTATVSDSVIELINRLRTGNISPNLFGLLGAMAGNCSDGTVTLPNQMRRLCLSNANIEEAFNLLRSNNPSPSGPLKALAKSMPLTCIARDVGLQLNASGGHVIEPAKIMPIINKYIAARDDGAMGVSVVFTSQMCIDMFGNERNHDIAAHIVSSLLIDESSPKHSNRNKIYDPRYLYIGVFNGSHKAYGNMTILVYSKTVSTTMGPAAARPGAVSTAPGARPAGPTSPGSRPAGAAAAAPRPAGGVASPATRPAGARPPPPRSPAGPHPPVPSGAGSTPAAATSSPATSATPTSPAAAAPAASAGAPAAGAAASSADDTHTITKISETPDKQAYTMELCHLTPEEFANATMLKKGAFVVLRHAGREQMWRMPFPLPKVSAISAYCQEADTPNGHTSTLMLKIAKELSDVPGGKIIDVVAENTVVPTNPTVPPKVRPQIKLKSSSAESIEAWLGVCSSDVHVNVKLVRTEVARSNVLFEFQFQERTAAGTFKMLKGNQTVRLPFVCSKADITMALEEGVLNIRIHAPKPTPFDPNEKEEIIAHT